MEHPLIVVPRRRISTKRAAVFQAHVAPPAHAVVEEDVSPPAVAGVEAGS